MGRDAGGRIVREAWIRWALTQPNPKPSWLTPYDELDEPDKEADRQIYEACLVGEERMVSLYPGIPELPKWLLDAATRIDQWCAKHLQGPWEILGVRGGYPRDDGQDSKRLDWIVSQVQQYGNGHDEPCEASWYFQWQQQKPGDQWTGLRDWIDNEISNHYRIL